jgi:predicted TIM-barrel fold metal-dependent hydrolase
LICINVRILLYAKKAPRGLLTNWRRAGHKARTGSSTVGFIDTDTHVIECEESWDYLDPTERKYRPAEVEVSGVNGAAPKHFYLIGETFCRRFPTNVMPEGYGAEYSAAVVHLTDPSVRLRKMDALGTDVQIVISTNFIAAEIEDALAEAAVMRSWNRWMAERTAGYRDRLPWVLVCPTRDIDRAIQELEFGKKNGAVGVMMKGVEHGYYLDDPRFDPLYAKAEDLDLAIVIHQGAARRHIEGAGIARTHQSAAASVNYSATVMMGLYAVLASDIYKRFPKLRWNFVESGVSWVPYVLHHRTRGKAAAQAASFVTTGIGPTRSIPPLSDMKGEFEMRNIFVSCEADEDIDYVARLIGDGQITVATDFGHNDAGADPSAHSAILQRPDVDKKLARLVTDDNGRRAFNIPADFRPTENAAPVRSRELELATL